MDDGVNIAARLEGIAKPGTTCLSEDAYLQVSGRHDAEAREASRRYLGPSAVSFKTMTSWKARLMSLAIHASSR